MEITSIVVVAYNRPKSLNRILSSLANAKYDIKDIPLIISIDKGDNFDVLKIAKNFKWEHGKKHVIYQEKNLGLRKHVLKCGDLTEEYGNIIMLEDDLYVSPLFYNYATKALNFVKNNNFIAGVSLYNHLFNVHALEPFEAINDGYDNWYFQFACSWGQAWTKKQWNGFKEWYILNSNKSLADREFPQSISSWPESSWLKYFMKYLVEMDKFFFYPRISYTTNFSDNGIHANGVDTTFQVSMQMYNTRELIFSQLNESKSIYNVFFENIQLYKYLNIDKNDLDIDLYGIKDNCYKRYYLSCKHKNYKILRSFACELRPQEANVIYEISGNDFFLYDTAVKCKNLKLSNEFYFRKNKYRIKNMSKKQYLCIIHMCLSRGVKAFGKQILHTN